MTWRISNGVASQPNNQPGKLSRHYTRVSGQTYTATLFPHCCRGFLEEQNPPLNWFLRLNFSTDITFPLGIPTHTPKERLWTIIRDRTHNKRLGLRSASYDTVRIEYAVPKKRVEKALQLYLKRIRSKIHLRQAILFGSYAKGNYSSDSDIDIAIVADRFPENQAVRYALLKESILGQDLQPFAYTVTEWREMAKTRSGFFQDILKHGKILYPPRPQTRRRVAQAS